MLRKLFLIFLVILFSSITTWYFAHDWLAKKLHQKSICDASIPEVLADPRLKWIAHGGGSYKGIGYTESLEALNESYDQGFRAFEFDVRLGQDRKIIFLHDWKDTYKRDYGYVPKKPTQQEFYNLKHNYGLTVMSISRLIEWLATHKDALIIFDVKEKKRRIIEVLADVMQNYKDQIIVEVFSIENYKLAQSLGLTAFPSMYGSKIKMSQWMEFILENRPKAVVFPTYKVYRYQYACELKKANIPVLVHPISWKLEIPFYQKRGVFGFYTPKML